MDRLGVGMIGLGDISHAHIETIKKLEQLELLGISSLDFENAQIKAREIGCTAYQSGKDLIKDPKIDLVVMLTPPGVHKDYIFEAINNKKHILLEKPIGTNLKEIQHYIEAAEEKKVSLSVISQHRFDEASTFLKQKIENGFLGDIVGANCNVNWYRETEYYQSWRSKKELSGGGVLSIQAIHTIDLMLWYLGAVESVKGYTTNRLHKEIEVEDTAMAVVKFSNGALGNISATTSSYPGYPAKLDVMGTKGSATIENDQIVFYQSSIDSESIDVQDRKKESNKGPSDVTVDSFVAQYENVISSIKNNQSSVVSGQEAFKPYQLIDAIYRSSISGEEIKL